VFVSSGFRTAFGQDESQVEEEEHVAPKSDEGSGEAPSESQEPSQNHQAASGEQELSENLEADGNHQTASGEQEKSGKLQADPDDQGRNELLASAEDGEFDANRRNADVENVANEPEVVEQTDTGRSSNLDTNYDCRNNRYAPPTHRVGPSENSYVITEARLREIRGEFLYCFFDQGGDDGNGDYQTDIHNSVPQVHKNFNFQLPFFGFRFNYTRLSMNGYLEFSDPPEHYTYPLVFPVKDWPRRNDPAFIGIFFSKTRIGRIRNEDIDQRRPGVYFRLERDLETRTDQFGVEMRERLKWDVREGIIGAETFVPKHAVIVTWKNMSFAGGIDNSLFRTNTFQLVLATDEVITYAIFNYVNLQWSSHTEAGGDTTNGEGGVPAYIGFNAGNGTRSYEYMPYSQNSVLRDLVGRGWTNGFPGRHIFRIDEKIMVGNCNKDLAGTNLPLMFAPESGNMLGGTVVNITGPCFFPNEQIQCRFDDTTVSGTVVDFNRAICVQPFMLAEGYVRFEIATDVSKFHWKGRYFVETPATATERIFFDGENIHQRAPAEIRMTWNRFNLTTSENIPIRISLWGYRETTIRPELLYIDMIEDSTVNTGSYTISPGNYRSRSNPRTENVRFGFIHINLTNPASHAGLTLSPVLWSRPIPLAWYYGPQWERRHGSRWAEVMCNDWIRDDRFLKNFAAEIPQCPCTLAHALSDKGRFLPDFDCDKDINPSCFYHNGAVHCVRSGAPSIIASGQQCCYDKNNFLMLSYDQQWGSRPHRSHNLGFLPWNEANKVPTLSHWFHDMAPFYFCCLWQEEQAVGCETFRFERRPTQDCIAYQSPSVATVFGDPHIITFDDLEYTFNGMGEFVLLHVDAPRHRLDVQGRFEQLPNNIHGEVRATQLTAVAARENSSTIVEVRVRPRYAQWRYHLDVFAGGRRVYFDRPSLRVQHFPGVTVYMPTYILNQSEIIMMFESGAGVEVVENEGFMTTRVYLPWTFMNKTRGLFGNWSNDITDDFTLPNGMLAGVGTNINNFEGIHRDFGIHWLLEDREDPAKGVALFTREFGRTANFYANRTFVPEFRKHARDIIPPNRTRDLEMAQNLCGEAYQCLFDYALSLNRDMAHFTRNYLDSFVNIKAKNRERVISCGVLETPRFGRKSNFLFVPGTRVTFECNQDFILIGDQRRLCTEAGNWDTPVYGYTECLRQQEYSSRQAGITAGIVLAVLVPILLGLVCVAYQLFVRRKKDPVEYKFKDTPPVRIEPQLSKLQELDNDELTALKKKETEVN